MILCIEHNFLQKIILPLIFCGRKGIYFSVFEKILNVFFTLAIYFCRKVYASNIIFTAKIYMFTKKYTFVD